MCFASLLTAHFSWSLLLITTETTLFSTEKQKWHYLLLFIISVTLLPVLPWVMSAPSGGYRRSRVGSWVCRQCLVTGEEFVVLPGVSACPEGGSHLTEEWEEERGRVLCVNLRSDTRSIGARCSSVFNLKLCTKNIEKVDFYSVFFLRYWNIREKMTWVYLEIINV